MAQADDRLDVLFHAVADPTRRRLIEALRERPGLTTAELAASVRGMTRWGVMKHLDVLAAAGVIQTLPEGRRRRHYVELANLAPLTGWLDSI
ncbi:MAG: helix-turn-helix domain-containing protein [Candidatus Limnocylindrales bacterium]